MIRHYNDKSYQICFYDSELEVISLNWFVSKPLNWKPFSLTYLACGLITILYPGMTVTSFAIITYSRTSEPGNIFTSIHINRQLFCIMLSTIHIKSSITVWKRVKVIKDLKKLTGSLRLSIGVVPDDIFTY